VTGLALPSRGPLVALLTVQVLFGLHAVLSKLAFPAFGAGGVSLARVVGAALVFQVIRVARREPSLPWRMHARVAVASAFGVVANQLLFMYGLERTSATHATILVTTVPVATLLVAVAAGREALLWHRAVGITLAFIGAALVVTSRGALAGGEWLGNLMVLGNSFFYAIYLVMGRDLLAGMSPWSLAAWLFTWGVVPVLLVTGLPVPQSPDAVAWGALTAIVFGSTIGTYLLNLVALRSLPSSVVAVFVCLQPTIAAAVAWFALGEVLDGRTLVAGALTIAGMLVATRRG
jgi:drug/metabolite transporter (DMT)-like permease